MLSKYLLSSRVSTNLKSIRSPSTKIAPKSIRRLYSEEPKKDEITNKKETRPAHQLFNDEILDSDGEPLGYVKVTGDALLEKETRAARRTPALSTLEEHPALSGHFGTPENPVLVPSIFNSRQVGCFGDPTTRNHPIRYHTVHKEKPLVCMDCGQVFKLVTPEGEQKVHRGHH